jgi:DNA-binding GntR family transcriptional regulator
MSIRQIDLGAPLRTRQEVIIDRLRNAILRGDLRPGQKLDQSELAEALGVSRSPIREALRTLSAEGLVEVIPHRGAIVAELSADELEEILILRGVLEGMAARLAVPKMDDERVKALQVVFEEMNRTIDPDRWVELNHRFHQTIYQAANRPRLLSLINNLRNTITPYMRQYIASSGHIREVALSHQLIFEGCVKRDPVLVEQETQKHLAAAAPGIIVYAKSQTPAREKLDLVASLQTESSIESS